MKRANTITLVLVAWCSTVLAQPQQPQQRQFPQNLSPYFDEQTIAVGVGDVQRLDVDALEKQVHGMVGAMKLDKVDAESLTKNVRQAAGMVRTWKEQFLKAGGRQVYAVLSMDDLPGGIPLLIVPHAKEADVEQLKSLFVSGHADGANVAQFAEWPEVVRPLDETTLFVGDTGQWERVNKGKRTPRPDILKAADALPAGEGAAVRVVLAPSEDVRKATAGLLPPAPAAVGGGLGQVLVNGVISATLTADGTPQASLNLTVQSKDAPSADALSRLVYALITDTVKKARLEPGVVRTLQPTVKGDRVVFAYQGQQFDAIVAQALAPLMRHQRMNASRQLSASNMRQVLVGIHMYVNDRRGAWPKSLQELVDAKYFDAPSLKAPYGGGGYVYVQPPVPINKLERPDLTMILYEETPLENIVNVGFADGHVEAFTKDQFEKWKADQEKGAPPQPAQGRPVQPR